MEYQQPLLKYPHSNNSLLSSGNVKKSTAYEPRTEAISPVMNDDIINAEDSNSRSTKDEQTLIVEKLKKVEAEIVQTDLQIVRLRRQKEQLEQAQAAPKPDDDQENVCDTKQLSIAKLVYHENRIKAQKSHAKLECFGGSTDLPIYNQPSDNVIYHHNATKFSHSFKKLLIDCFRSRFQARLKLEDSVSTEYDRRMEKWLRSIELEDSQPTKRKEDAKTRDLFEKQFPEIKKARESGEKLSRVGQRVARSDAEVADLVNGIMRREDHDRKVKSYAVIPPMLEEMRSKKPKYINTNGYVEDIVAEYKEFQILNTWTDEEKDIFKENYLQHPKNFGLIARMTGRKNVADCVQYYYLSKKSENYKGLLKRQQRRRTRSLVRPAAATPANTEPIQNETEKTNGINHGGDAVTSDANEQNSWSKSSTSTDQVEVKKETCDMDLGDNGNNELKANCCICNCDFSDNNQFRNVTRSNHQLYGIALDAFRPGMKICYSCRFRHVKQSNFEEPTVGLEAPDNELMPGQSSDEILNNDTTMMEVDPFIDKKDTDESRQAQMIVEDSSNKNVIPSNLARPNDSCSSVDLSPEKINTTTNNSQPVQGGNTSTISEQGAPKERQKTFVRDIIYQAIEMSFKNPIDALEGAQATAPKLEATTENAVNTTIPQNPVGNLMHPKAMSRSSNPALNHPIPQRLQNVQNLNYNQHQMQMDMQQKQRQNLMDFNIRQQQLQAHMQQTQFQPAPPLNSSHMLPHSQAQTSSHQQPPLLPHQAVHHPGLPQHLVSSQFPSHQIHMVQQQPSQPPPPFMSDVMPLRHELAQQMPMLHQQSGSSFPQHIVGSQLSTKHTIPPTSLPPASQAQPFISGSGPRHVPPPSPSQASQLTRLALTQCYPVQSRHPSPPHAILTSNSLSNTTLPSQKKKSPPMAHGDKDLRGSGSIDDGVLNLSAKSERLKSPETVAPPQVTEKPSTPTVNTASTVVESPVTKQESSREDSKSPSEMVIDESAGAPSPGSASSKQLETEMLCAGDNSPRENN